MTKSEFKRIIAAGGFEVNGVVVKDFRHKLEVGDKIKIGKKIFGTVVDGRQLQYVVANMIDKGVKEAVVVDKFGNIE